MEEKQYQEIAELANHILKISRNTLVLNLRFMDRAISRMKIVPIPEQNVIAVDGQYIYYDPLIILKSYKAEKNLPTRQYLHMIMHCVFQHSFVQMVDAQYWNLACDIAVENVILDLRLPCVSTSRDSLMISEIANLKDKVKYINAECIYHYLKKSGNKEKLENLQELFFFDDHAIWYEPKKYEEQDYIVANSNLLRLGLLEVKDDWKEISRQMQMDLESFSQMPGDKAGNLIQNLEAIHREKYDYSVFLRKFAVLGESMTINDDEFDYIFYTYGMKLYDKMPLIEPLEYKEVKKIKEFVIAIDTSGSTSGELVQKFLQKTYNILKQQESFFSKINLYIVQCDTEIQEAVKITKQEEFESYFKSMKIRGLGGTDFRPVFAYVNELIDDGIFTNLKGMLYFTDGYGMFPSKQPDYDVAFIYLDDGYNNPSVPVWAMKLILSEEELQ